MRTIAGRSSPTVRSSSRLGSCGRAAGSSPSTSFVSLRTLQGMPAWCTRVRSIQTGRWNSRAFSSARRCCSLEEGTTRSTAVKLASLVPPYRTSIGRSRHSPAPVKMWLKGVSRLFLWEGQCFLCVTFFFADTNGTNAFGFVHTPALWAAPDDFPLS